MRNGNGVGVRRCSVAPEPLLGAAVPDYADSFEIRLERPDAHTAEQWVRAALEQAQPPVRQLIELVHRRALRFRLGPTTSPDHVLGWRIVDSGPDLVRLEAAGPLGSGVIVARRSTPYSAVATTFVFFDRPIARHLWLVIGPLHRRIAPYLLRRAAVTLARQDSFVPRTRA